MEPRPNYHQAKWTRFRSELENIALNIKTATLEDTEVELQIYYYDVQIAAENHSKSGKSSRMGLLISSA